MTKGAGDEQRIEQRFSMHNAAVKIRRRGLGFNPWRYDLNLIDLSANGMAVLSPVFKLSLLQKIDFELSSGGFTTTGCAVVCNTGNSTNTQRYGLLFIETDQSFDAFLTGENLSSDEVKRLGEEIAEQYMYQRIATDSKLLRVQNQRMIDAVTTLADRLGQMGLYINDERGRVVKPADSIVVDITAGLSIPMLLAGDAGIKRITILLSNTREEGPIHYQIGDGHVFENIIDLLKHLCHCFDKISVS